MYCLLWQACYWIQQPAHLVFYSSSQKPCLYKGRTSCLAETQTNLKFHYKLPPKPCLEGYTKPANKVTSYTLLSCYDGNFCRSSPSQLYPLSLATPGTAAKISAACWGERQSPVCTRRGTQQKSPNSCLLLPVDPANLLRFFAYNMLQQTHCPKRTELNWVAGLQITKQPHFNHGYSSAKECRK